MLLLLERWGWLVPPELATAPLNHNLMQSYVRTTSLSIIALVLCQEISHRESRTHVRRPGGD